MIFFPKICNKEKLGISFQKSKELLQIAIYRMFVLRAVLKFTNLRRNLTMYIFVLLLIFKQYRKSYSRLLLIFFRLHTFIIYNMKLYLQCVISHIVIIISNTFRNFDLSSVANSRRGRIVREK